MAKGKGAKGAKGAKRGKGRGRKALANIKDYASLSCTRTLAVPAGQFTVNNMYQYMNIQLSDFGRAVQVAQAYQHFKIRAVTLRIKPTYDTFGQGGSSKMNLYYIIDKSGSIPANPTLEMLKQMGAKARALDEKPFEVTWAPAVLTTDMTQGGPAGLLQANQYKISPWLSTGNVPVNLAWAPNLTDHLGIYWYVEQLLTPVATPYMCEFEVQFEFKKPLQTVTPGANPAIAVGFAEINDSKDGVVGGPDGA